jgi:hypothetical protein
MASVDNEKCIEINQNSPKMCENIESQYDTIKDENNLQFDYDAHHMDDNNFEVNSNGNEFCTDDDDETSNYG